MEAAGCRAAQAATPQGDEPPGIPYPLSPGGQSGDWRSLQIYFDHPFLVPPVVLASGREENPVIPMVRGVTTHGFTAGVRNTDSVGRHALFNWWRSDAPMAACIITDGDNKLVVIEAHAFEVSICPPD